MTNENKINELASIALWAAQRLTHDERKKYVWEEVLGVIGEDHEYAESIKKDLNKLAIKRLCTEAKKLPSKKFETVEEFEAWLDEEEY